MMRLLKGALASVALLVGTSGEAHAQDWWWGITYNMSATASLPGSSDSDVTFVDDFSFRGIGLEARYVPNRGGNLSYGFSGSWNVLNEKTDEVVNLPGAAIGGTQLRYFNSVPLLVNAHYYFGSRGGIRPYAGINAGTYWIERRVDIGISSIKDDNWHFGWAPELGVIVPLGRPEVALIANARYNWAFSAGGSGDQKYWGFNVGFMYR
ncbi:MAG: porin family protein [marine benthic group bacterium]|nr:porin family protein [Gemmatimonadota bacterium]